MHASHKASGSFRNFTSTKGSYMKTVLITGGSGLIGQRLTEMLLGKGYNVTHLGRRAGIKDRVKAYAWDIEKGEIDPGAVQTADHIVHLAGANIGEGRWTNKRKRKIISSRTDSAKLIYQHIRKSGKKIDSFISGSAVGYYGAITSEKIFTEQDPAASDFLGEICRLWEEAAGPIAALKIRTVKLRMGVVLSASGGALKKMSGPVKSYIGSPLGTGKQYVPWIHIDDVCGIIIRAIEDESLSGVYNTCAPQHATNAEMTHAIAHALNKPLILPAVPSFVLKMMFGEMSRMILNGSRVSCEKLLKQGYTFRFPGLQDAVNDLLKK